MDFDLMHEMGWSWPELKATPMYVRRYCWDLMQIQRQAEADKIEEARQEARHA